jgi:hypothetical protein
MCASLKIGLEIMFFKINLYKKIMLNNFEGEVNSNSFAKTRDMYLNIFFIT